MQDPKKAQYGTIVGEGIARFSIVDIKVEHALCRRSIVSVDSSQDDHADVHKTRDLQQPQGHLEDFVVDETDAATSDNAAHHGVENGVQLVDQGPASVVALVQNLLAGATIIVREREGNCLACSYLCISVLNLQRIVS